MELLDACCWCATYLSYMHPVRKCRTTAYLNRSHCSASTMQESRFFCCAIPKPREMVRSIRSRMVVYSHPSEDAKCTGILPDEN